MFKPHYGYCKFCEKDGQMIAVKSGHCQQCNHKNKQAKKKAAGKKTGNYQYVREATGEGEMMRAIGLDALGEEATVCFVCKTPIAALTYSNFAHVISKGKHPEFRLKPENIVILCHNYFDTGRSCHHIWDFKPRSEIANDPMWQEMIELEQQLKQEYKNLTDL